VPEPLEEAVPDFIPARWSAWRDAEGGAE